MSTHIKKLLSLLMSVAMVISMMPNMVLFSSAAEITDDPVVEDGSSVQEPETEISYYSGTPDWSWYEEAVNAGVTEVTLMTADELYGLAAVVNGFYFEGKNAYTPANKITTKDSAGTTIKKTLEGWTIKLGADMVLNEGKAKDWSKDTTGLYAWMPIGTGGGKFYGIFDGREHSISGIFSYYIHPTDGAGRIGHNNGLFGETQNATIMNLAILNSFFYASAATVSGKTNQSQFLGSVVSRAYGGTLKNLYSNARLVHEKKDYYTGGIAACVRNDDGHPGTVDGCIFAGSIETAANVTGGQFVGGIVGGSDGNGKSCTITNSMFCGSINGKSDKNVGGILGVSGAGTVGSQTLASVVSNCIVAGTITHTSTDTETDKIGAVVGLTAQAAAQHTITDCYYSEDIGLELFGGKNATSVNVNVEGSEEVPQNDLRGDVSALNLPKWEAYECDYPVPTSVKALYEKHVTPDNEHNLSEADCLRDQYCLDCGKLWKEALDGHTDVDPKDHVCEACGANLGGHVDVDENFVCDYCEENLHQHNWSEEWTVDEYARWHECLNANCTVTKVEEKDGYHKHSFFINENGVPKCETCHYELPVSYYDGTPDTTWYNNNDTEFILYHADQLFGLATLVNGGNKFIGKTIKLGTNMVINKGEAAKWASATPKYGWTFIGSAAGKSFNGIFDGQGHYIDGVYQSVNRNAGFFLWTVDAVIKDVAIVNSYFETKQSDNNGQGLASFVGRCVGTTLQNLYTDAILLCKAVAWDSSNKTVKSSDYVTGGIVGFAYGSGSHEKGSAVAANDFLMENCIFAGTIDSDANGAGRYVGGLVGHQAASTITIKNCLMAGTIISNDNHVGGILGYSGVASGLTITQCLVSGSMNAVVYADDNSAQANDTNLATWGGVIGSFGKANTHEVHDNYYHGALINITDPDNPVKVEMPLYGGTNSCTGATDNEVLTAAEMMGADAFEDMPALKEAWTTYACDYPVPTGVKAIFEKFNTPNTLHNPGAEADCGHDQTCLDCGTVIVPASGEHEDTDLDGICNVCGVSTHEHRWESEWDGDEYMHWHECANEDCFITKDEDKDGYEEHSFFINENGVAECKTCHYKLTVSHYDGTADATWYDDSETEFILFHADQLFGLAQLVNGGKTFQGQTVKLAVNVVINQGKAEDQFQRDVDAGMRYDWTSIGTGIQTTNVFSGTFDGLNHYISGMYYSKTHNGGMFWGTYGATIKNFALVNTYFEHTATTRNGQGLASFVGWSSGGITLQNLYTNAILVNKAYNKGATHQQSTWSTGGIIAFANGDSLIENCVFAGSITDDTYGAGENVGGIVGTNENGNVTIQNCLFVGKLSSNDSCVGGIIGRSKVGGLKVLNCVVAGEMSYKYASIGLGSATNINRWGAIAGYLQNNAAIDNCYYIHNAKDISSDPVELILPVYGSESAVTATNCAALTEQQLKGDISDELGLTAWTEHGCDFPVPTTVDAFYKQYYKPVDEHVGDENMDHLCDNCGDKRSDHTGYEDDAVCDYCEKTIFALVNNQPFASLVEAIAAAQDDDVITLIANCELQDIVLTLDKDITIDFNGFTVTGKFNEVTTNKPYNGSLQAAVTQFVLVKDHASVTLKDSGVGGGLKAIAGTYGNLSNLIRVEAEGELVIESGNYNQDLSVIGAGMIDSRGDENIIIKGGTFNLGNVGTQKNGSPWILNTAGQNTKSIIVKGGTFNADILHQFYPFEADMPKELALKKVGEKEYTVVPAVAYVVEAEWSSNWYYNDVGYATLEEAIAACQGVQEKIYYSKTYYSNPDEIILLQNIELDEALVIPEGKSVILDLNEFFISQTIESTGEYAMITNNGNLTIKASGGGKISLTDNASDVNWAVSIISNSGELVIEAGNFRYAGPVGGRAIFQTAGSVLIESGKYEGRIFVQPNVEGTSLVINGGKFYDAERTVFIDNQELDVNFRANGGTFHTLIEVADVEKLLGCIARPGATVIGTDTDDRLFDDHVG